MITATELIASLATVAVCFSLGVFIIFARRDKRFRDRLIDLIIRIAQRRPYFHLEGYMDRWWLLKFSRFQPISIRVHRIYASDPGEVLHDHPSPSISIILRGGYLELTPAMQKQHPSYDRGTVYGDRPRLVAAIRNPGDIIKRKATDRHRLVVAPGKECWSLFIMWRREHDWGFYPDSGFVGYKTYLGLHEQKKPEDGASVPPRTDFSRPDQQQKVEPTTGDAELASFREVYSEKNQAKYRGPEFNGRLKRAAPPPPPPAPPARELGPRPSRSPAMSMPYTATPQPADPSLAFLMASMAHNHHVSHDSPASSCNDDRSSASDSYSSPSSDSSYSSDSGSCGSSD